MLHRLYHPMVFIISIDLHLDLIIKYKTMTLISDTGLKRQQAVEAIKQQILNLRLSTGCRHSFTPINNKTVKCEHCGYEKRVYFAYSQSLIIN